MWTSWTGKKTSNSGVIHKLLEAEAVKSVMPGFENVSHCEEHFAIMAAKMYRKIREEFPENPDVAYFTVSNLMLLRPWDLFSYPSCEPKDEELVDEITGILDSALAVDPNHIGLCHMKVHFEEMGPDPGRAGEACDVLRKEVDAAHLLHMSTHIDVLVGDYDSATAYNKLAITADGKMVNSELKISGKDSFYLGYICHDYHMMCYAGMLGGFEGQAMWAARGVRDVLDDDTLRMNPALLIGCEAFRPMEVHVMCR
jgi:hypothetical protein